MTAVAPPQGNPFLDLSPLARLLILFYLGAYRVVFPLIHALMSDGAKDLLGPRFLAELCLTGLIAFPFLFHRREYGWLHPLVLPALFIIGKTVTKNPFTLFFPLDFPTVDFTVETISKAAALALSANDLAWVRLQLSLVLCLAQATYLGFFLIGPRFRVPRIAIYHPPNIALVAGLFIAAFVAIAFAFIQSMGGATELLVAMRGGRRALFAGQGQFVYAGVIAPLIAAVWFMYGRNPWRSPAFVMGLVAALATALLVSGARSALIMPALTILLLWWKRRGRALVLPTFGAAILALIVIGSFGSVRQNWKSDTVDFTVFNPAQYRSAIDYALEDIRGRTAEESDLAVVAGINDKGLLWGRTYLNALTFWIPRAIWPQKPVGVDFYNMWINFNDAPIGSRPPIQEAWGIPVSAQMEAYWNFGAAGVIVVFALLGIFHATLVKAAYIYQKVPLFWVVHAYAVLNVGGTSRSIVDFARTLAVLAVFAVIAGMLRFKGTEGIASIRSLRPR